MDNLEIFDREELCFHHPCNIIISGSTGAGKSTLLGNILKHREELFHPKPVDLLVAYGQNSKLIEQLQEEGVKTCRGLPAFDVIDEQLKKPSLVVFDDLMDADEKYLNTLFLKKGNNNNTSIIFVVQSLFTPKLRLLKTNSQYILLLKSPNQTLNIRTFFSHIYGSKFKEALKAYSDCVENKKVGSYLRISLHPSTDPAFRQGSFHQRNLFVIKYEPA